MKTYHVYGIGNALVDKEFEIRDDFLTNHAIEKGMMTLVEADVQAQLLEQLHHTYGLKKRASGGSAANSIMAVAGFGGDAFYSCKVASDETGDFYVNDLKAAGVDTNLGDVRENGVTGRCLVLVTPDAERTMLSYLGITAELTETELNTDALKHAEYLYIEGYLVTSDSNRATAIEAKRAAEHAGIKTAMTFSDPAMVNYFKPGLTEIIGEGVDLLFCNQEEALTWAETDQLETAINALKRIAKTFAITLGSDGALIYDGQACINIPGVNANAVDTNGAGDMFAGAMLYGITHGYSFTEAGQLACTAAARVVEQFGPRLPLALHRQLLTQG